MQRTGCFITLEGIEGVGKSTHQKFIQSYLASKEIPVVLTREPGGTPVAEEIRQILLKHHTEKMTDDAELLLFFASRSQHIAEVIIPALKKGTWVVCDRFTDTTYAYQGSGRNVSLEKIAILEKWTQGNLHPDRVLLFDAPVEIALRRAKGRGNLDRFESEEVNFFERARMGFLERAKKFPERYYVLDASQPLNLLKQELIKILDVLIHERS